MRSRHGNTRSFFTQQPNRPGHRRRKRHRRGPAQALAQAGADVAVADLHLATAERSAEELTALGVRSLAVQVDVTQADQVKRMVATVIEAWGRLDVAVNSADIASRSRAEGSDRGCLGRGRGR